MQKMKRSTAFKSLFRAELRQSLTRPSVFAKASPNTVTHSGHPAVPGVVLTKPGSLSKDSVVLLPFIPPVNCRVFWRRRTILILFLLVHFCIEAKKKEKEDSLKPLRIAWHASKIGASITVYYFWHRILNECVRPPGSWSDTFRGVINNLLKPWNDEAAWVNPPFISFGVVTFCTFVSGVRGLKQEISTQNRQNREKPF